MDLLSEDIMKKVKLVKRMLQLFTLLFILIFSVDFWKIFFSAGVPDCEFCIIVPNWKKIYAEDYLVHLVSLSKELVVECGYKPKSIVDMFKKVDEIKLKEDGTSCYEKISSMCDYHNTLSVKYSSIDPWGNEYQISYPDENRIRVFTLKGGGFLGNSEIVSELKLWVNHQTPPQGKVYR